MAIRPILRLILISMPLLVILAPAGNRTDLAAQPAAKTTEPPIDLETISAFHITLEDICITRSITVVYDGPLGRRLQGYGVRQKTQVMPSPLPYSWSVVHTEGPDSVGRVLFHIRVSLEDSDAASYTCRVNDKNLYVSIEPVVKRDDGNILADSADPDLRNVTISDLLAKTPLRKKKDR